MNRPADELALVFPCDGEDLVGILHRPENPSRTGLLVITGGPQYRAGSHRQFVLLARSLSDAGFAVLRFDYRGMGDSSGEPVTFDRTAPDISAAIDCLLQEVPAVSRVVLWGLCDAASAAMIYAREDTRVAGLVLLNPWVRTETGEARTLLRHYYLRRLISAAFWRDLMSGRFAPSRAWRALRDNLGRALTRTEDDASASAGQATYIDRMRDGFAEFSGVALLIISGEDLTAAEFQDLTSASASWRRLFTRPGIERQFLPTANHTFSSAGLRRQVATITRDWLLRLPP